MNYADTFGDQKKISCVWPGKAHRTYQIIAHSIFRRIIQEFIIPVQDR